MTLRRTGYLTVEEVAQELRVSRMTIYRMTEDPANPLGAIRVGRSVRLDAAVVYKYLQNGGDR